VLYRKEPFGNVDIKKNGTDEGGEGHDQGDGTEAENEFQSAAIEFDDGVEGVFRLTKEPGFVFWFIVAEEFGAHHGSEGEGDDGGNEDSDRQSDGKFAEQAANDVSHEKQRNQNRDERNRQRENGETDLFGALERSLQRRLSFFNVTADVFNHDDGIVDDKA